MDFGVAFLPESAIYQQLATSDEGTKADAVTKLAMLEEAAQYLKAGKLTPYDLAGKGERFQPQDTPRDGSMLGKEACNMLMAVA